MAKHKLSHDSVIYQYTLLYRFTRKHFFYWCYLGCLLLWLFVDTVYWGFRGLILFGAAGLSVLLVHSLIALLLRKFSKGTVPRSWGWAFTFPFFGYLPSGHTPVTAWNRANRHRLLIGFVAVALLYVWLPVSWLANATAAHYFLLFPQLIYIGRCMRINRTGLVKVDTDEISLYKN